MTDMGSVGIPTDVPGRPGKCGIENGAGNASWRMTTTSRFPMASLVRCWCAHAGPTSCNWDTGAIHPLPCRRGVTCGFTPVTICVATRTAGTNSLTAKKDAMRRFGENISSYEVELALQSHPDVQEVAVYAVASQLEEDEVMTSLVLKPGSAVTTAELLKHCETELPYYAVPRYYRVVLELPRTPTAKIQKGELRQIGIDDRTWDAGPRGRSKRG